ncbi:hypothetical protein NBRC10512_006332 [Rhodotorula toruloides]|uniref:RHTO0S07e03180g1_1 n=2 Tax=Rhodotorula toruloides TaxID=5286 RepID=A0A061AYT3_RHOTO|nr:uncharacterized protein RHTO_02804 [Rhodotorula toruloides NP11]EMS25077.1 hypothetical protein RHTO_02804 [Rhodotorula toruloides NP11]CDR42711.1 RHTO0S07e03180g1_1 [Rhodotorula toruloides]
MSAASPPSASPPNALTHSLSPGSTRSPTKPTKRTREGRVAHASVHTRWEVPVVDESGETLIVEYSVAWGPDVAVMVNVKKGYCRESQGCALKTLFEGLHDELIRELEGGEIGPEDVFDEEEVPLALRLGTTGEAGPNAQRPKKRLRTTAPPSHASALSSPPSIAPPPSTQVLESAMDVD